MDNNSIVDARIPGEYDGRDARIPDKNEETGEEFFWVNTVETARWPAPSWRLASHSKPTETVRSVAGRSEIENNDFNKEDYLWCQSIPNRRVAPFSAH